MNKAKELVKLKKKAFKLWSEKVRAIGCCELCGIKNKEPTLKGKPAVLNAHHVIGRENHRLAWDIRNGISLCQWCHKWSKVGPHRGSIIFNEWYRLKYPENYDYLLKTHEEPFEITLENMQKVIEKLSII
jgi:hypothetical protein